MSVRSRSLWGGVRAPALAGAPEVYEAPAGYFVVVKSLRIVNTDAGPVSVWVTVDPGTDEQPWLDGVQVLGHETLIDGSWNVLPDAATVRVWADTADAIVTWGSGAVLGGPSS